MADISKINLGGVEYDIRDQKLKEDVEKKADKTYVDEETERVVGYAEEVANNAEKAAKKYADDNKVAKVDGKQLSTEDFTTTLKQKLEGLTNYDDADVRLAITELQNDLDAIVNGDATSAIDSIQEILAFLSTITDTQTLAGIVADLKQYVDDKVASGSGGITEEKEVYIGADEPTDDGAKLWIDPTGTPSGGNGGNSGGAKIYEVYASPQNDDELAANIKVYNAVMNGENAIYRTYSEMGWLTSNLALFVSSVANLMFEISQNAADGSGLTNSQISLFINSNGSATPSVTPTSVPSTSKVEEMIANVGGGGGGSVNEPLVLYFAMDGNLSEQQKQSNATNVALLIDAISQGKYGNNFLIGLVVSGSVMTLAQPFFYAAFNGMLKVGTSFSAVKESTQFYWVAQRLSFGTDGNVTIE